MQLYQISFLYIQMDITVKEYVILFEGSQCQDIIHVVFREACDATGIERRHENYYVIGDMRCERIFGVECVDAAIIIEQATQTSKAYHDMKFPDHT